MEKRIIIKETVFEQLKEEYLYIAENSSIETAEKFRLEFFEKIESIIPFHNRFPICKFRDPIRKNYRQMVWRDYLILLKVTPKAIYILSLFHTKKDPKKLNIIIK